MTFRIQNIFYFLYAKSHVLCRRFVYNTEIKYFDTLLIGVSWKT